MHREITFDRFIRGLMVLSGGLVAYLLINQLSSVLLPFVVAWLLAYLIFPLVSFLQYRMHLHFRIPCIMLALAIVFSCVGLLLLFIVPPTIRELLSLHETIIAFINDIGQTPLALQIDRFVRHNFDEASIARMLHGGNAIELAQVAMGKTWSLLNNAVALVSGLFTVIVTLLYLFFMLLDYEELCQGFRSIVPVAYRAKTNRIFDDAERSMNAYFRGQALIAFIVGVLFSIGFSIVGLPVAIGLGLLIGMLNLIPYLQVAGIVPALLLAFLHSMQTGENFLLIVFYCFIVFIIVQGIQDLFLTPRIMGHMMGLRPAVILLALSVWGGLLGFMGLIIALPLTTLIISYYKLFVLKEEE